jgi:hypothetical protein
MANEEEIRRQLIAAHEGADYQVNSPMDLVPALPDGPETEFSSGDFSITAMELNMQTDGYRDYPYYDVHSLVDDIMRGLKKEFPEHFSDGVDAQTASNSGDTEVYSEDEKTEVYSKEDDETEVYDNAGEQNTSDFSYCPSCGESLSGSPSFCKYCGQNLSEC